MNDQEIAAHFDGRGRVHLLEPQPPPAVGERRPRVPPRSSYPPPPSPAQA
ncbi:hypothetical protein GTY23_17835 [Streptomyces sp. SID5998]|nr:hypothetical protein [Streptomyces sp. SID5998]